GVGRPGEVQTGKPLPERLINRLSMWKKIGAKEVVEMGAQPMWKHKGSQHKLEKLCRITREENSAEGKVHFRDELEKELGGGVVKEVDSKEIKHYNPSYMVPKKGEDHRCLEWVKRSQGLVRCRLDNIRVLTMHLGILDLGISIRETRNGLRKRSIRMWILSFQEGRERRISIRSGRSGVRDRGLRHKDRVRWQVLLQLSYHLQLARNERWRRARGMSKRETTHKTEGSGRMDRSGGIQAGEPLPERLIN
ncbi:MAG: hypothetical protein EZS28_037564, partial [Streblomastix strix]